MHIAELVPVGILETTLGDEIRRATWRLRRCGRVESTLLVRLEAESEYILDPMEEDRMATAQKSVDRARAQAHRLLHKCTAELRRLQTERCKREKESPVQPKPGNVVPMTTRTQSQPTGTPEISHAPADRAKNINAAAEKRLRQS